MFDMTNDSYLFRTREQFSSGEWNLTGNTFIGGNEIFVPLYEDWMIHQFDHRFQSDGRYDPEIVEKQNANWVPMPRYWVQAAEVKSHLPDLEDVPSWYLGFRNRTRDTDSRTAIFSIIPGVAVGNPVPIMLISPLLRPEIALLIANLNSLIFDYVVRQKMGGLNLNFFYIKQFPVLRPEIQHSNKVLTLRDRVLELVYTAHDLQPFAQDLGYNGPPFKWDVDRRFLIRCELDAAFFHLYGISLTDVDYIMDTFPIVKRKDEEKYKEYRTKRVILEIYDEMERAIRTGQPYQTRLNPPPGDTRTAHQS
jgi:hypothetical protein